jgi:exodeoxyribonuclease V beta subunit
MQTDYFDPISTDLRAGVNLIEASAGTGKTYAIAMLVLRFVVEQGISIDKLLVVTFTKAATEELKDRIRNKLAEAKRALAQVKPTVSEWLDHLAVPPEQMEEWLRFVLADISTGGLAMPPEQLKQRLTLALLDIDKAGIFTIHSFCQHVLHDYALESGQLFDAELTGDLTAIKQACSDDFWRQQMRRPIWEVAALTAEFKTPDALLASLKAFPGAGLSAATPIKIYPEPQPLDHALAELKQRAQSAAGQLPSCAAKLRQGLAAQKFKPVFNGDFEQHHAALAAWLAGQSIDLPDAAAFELLTTAGLSNGLDGNKFRTTKALSGAQRKAQYLEELAIDTTAFDALAAARQQVALMLRRELLDNLRAELDKRLQQMNVLSFDDLIGRLAEALQTEKGALLGRQLRHDFAVALIDEFQDTDANQWLIFSSIFAPVSEPEPSARPYLYLIGDPKQAIYKFRGADIYSYLGAQQQAQHRFTLGKNWRSHPHLVAAVNALFSRKQAFLLDDLTFKPVQAAKTAEAGALQLDGAALAPMMLWQLPESASNNGYWTAGKAATAITQAVVDEVLALLAHAYRFVPGEQPVQPKDLAILVRTNGQARDYQAALREAGVPAVINNTASVFATTEAADLYTLLQAVANPGDTGLLKQALTLSWLGLDGAALYQLINNETELDHWLSRFSGYYQDWQTGGLMPMLTTVLEHEQVRQHIATHLLAERQLTNLQQLIELLQQAVLDEHLGINKTLDWLKAAIAKAETGSDENTQLRLESDDDAVKIVTMHRSKGLEYPIVFCPCLWQDNDRLHSEKHLLTCHSGGTMQVDLGSEQFEKHREQAKHEERAEDLRVLYVAVTRAKARCYLVWANARSQENPNGSALAYLLEFAAAHFAAQQTALQNFVSQNPAAFAYQLLDMSAAKTGGRLHPKPMPPKLSPARKRQRSLYTRWQMSSYTALSALSQHDAPELPEDKAREQSERPERAVAELPRGAHTGNVVHELLENNPFAALAQRKDISAQREQACLRYGLKLEQPEQLNELLQRVVTTPLSATDTDFCLKNLPERQCLKEMPFYLAMQTMDAAHINAILQGAPAYQPLSAKALSGYLTGFIDLICQYKERYYVLDYKTNALPDYRTETLTAAMREHNYGLQYWLYTVVLHRYLQNRLPDYSYASHFGGVRYLFVRGMQPDNPMSGVYQDLPDVGSVEALADLFGGGRC